MVRYQFLKTGNRAGRINPLRNSNKFARIDIFAPHQAMFHKILIIDDVHPYLTDELQKAGIAFSYRPDISRAEILDILPSYSILVVRTKTPVDAELIACGTNLRLIARAGSGMDNVDTAAAEARGISCINVGEANANAVGEHALSLLLSLYNKVCQGDAQVREKIWDREGNRGLELDGKTVAIIGYGNTGSAFAHKLKGFDVKVLVYDKYKSSFSAGNVQEASLEQIFREADIVSLHIPLTAETRYLVNQEWLSAFVKPIHLINTSRGSVVNLAHLAQALQSGKLLGAGLDVLEQEKLQQLETPLKSVFEQLATTYRVVFTPHVAGWTVESYYKISYHLSLKIMAYATQPPNNQEIIGREKNSA